jgi:tryptophan 2-C-methyltransferase
MRVALINANRIRPPIAPIGLEYVAEALAASGHRAALLDLCWEDDPEGAIARFFAGEPVGLVGLSIRNTDDCSFTTRESFLVGYAAMVASVRKRTDAKIALGGVGFSVMPEAVIERCGADLGVRGDGEFVLPALASRLERGENWSDLPNLVFRGGSGWRRNPAGATPLEALPPMSRDFVDNLRYFREGGQAGFETKRGCPNRCVYCADPLAKGKTVRARPPVVVADEIARLAARGIDHLHTCDSEFNVPEAHAAAVCREIVRRGLGDRIRWYAYCAPVPFSKELAALMRRAGCAGINFGVDSGDPEMLARLGRDFGPGDIVATARLVREAGMAVMLDLLFGSPGETRESVVRTVDLVRRSEPDRAGVAVGVRVYPGTVLADRIVSDDLGEGLIGGTDLSDPVFFVEPAVAPFLFDLLDDLVGDDRRFLLFDSSRPGRNYNYNANQLLADAIQDGHRGAYWDILRRLGGAP